MVRRRSLLPRQRAREIAGGTDGSSTLRWRKEDSNRWSHLRSTRPIAACRFKGARNRLDGPVFGIILRALYKLEDMDDREQSTGPIGGNPYREVAGKLREVARECQLPRARREILDLAERFERRATARDRRAAFAGSGQAD